MYTFTSIYKPPNLVGCQLIIHVPKLSPKLNKNTKLNPHSPNIGKCLKGATN
jgi:hypothetical protein